MININLREDLFPEYPIIEGTKILNRVKNVFEEWKEDREEDKLRAFDMNYEESGDDFCIERLIRQPMDR